jgi:hypothetical protein
MWPVIALACVNQMRQCLLQALQFRDLAFNLDQMRFGNLFHIGRGPIAILVKRE